MTSKDRYLAMTDSEKLDNLRSYINGITACWNDAVQNGSLVADGAGHVIAEHDFKNLDLSVKHLDWMTAKD